MHESRSLRRNRACLAIIGVALLIAGCSDDDAADSTPTVAPTLSPLVTSAPSSAGAPATGAATTLAPPASATTSTTTAPPTTTTLPPTTTSTTTSTTTTTTSTTLAPTTTTTIVTQGAVVRVANATDINGAAGNLSQQLRDHGFTVADPVNASRPEEKLDVTKVYSKPEAEAVARSVAVLMGDGVMVLPLPSPAPIVGANVGLGDAGVLVMLGRDLAGRVEL